MKRVWTVAKWLILLRAFMLAVTWTGLMFHLPGHAINVLGYGGLALGVCWYAKARRI
jgi:hypothetical protein